jgi:hypothetical protein
MLAKPYLVFLPKREFRASIPAGNANRDENQLLQRQQRLESNIHSFLSLEAPDKSNGSRHRWYVQQ